MCHDKMCPNKACPARHRKLFTTPIATKEKKHRTVSRKTPTTPRRVGASEKNSKHIQNPPRKSPQNDPYSQRRPEGGPRGRQKETPKPSKRTPEEPPESVASNGQKKEAGTTGFDKAPGGSNVTFSTVFSLPEHPPGSPVSGPTATILGPDLVPVYMYIYIYISIDISIYSLIYIIDQ